MRKRSLFSALMLPALVALLLLPPLSCMVFRHAATQRAYSDAGRNLKALNQSILPIIDGTFNKTQRDEARDDVLAFLRKVSTAVKKANGSARVIILESRLQVIFPHDEEERADIADFSSLCIDHLPDEGEEENMVELTDDSGEQYLVQYYHLPTESKRVRYLIAYCSVSQLHTWVTEASLQVLIISAFFVMLIFIVLFFAICSISRSLKRLSKSVTTIGEGAFVQIDQPFALRELEDVRLATNRMSQHLQKTEQNQRNFLQNISHELRNPLMSIGGYAQGIERGIFSSPETAAHTILDESRRLTDLVSGLLTLSRLENDMQAVMLEKMLVVETVQDCLERANGMAIQRKIKLELQTFLSPVYVLANEELLCQVLDNLLSNAIRYAQSTVKLVVDQTAGTAVISVLDDGEGISEVDLPHLFERCYKGKDGHFGLGLAIAASSAEKMKGCLCAANSENGGAIFTLHLPTI